MYTMTGNMKKLLEIVSASKELAAEDGLARAKRPAPALWRRR